MNEFTKQLDTKQQIEILQVKLLSRSGGCWRNWRLSIFY